MHKYTIRLPRPHAKQRAIRRSPAKRHVVNAARRTGKTTLASIVAVESGLAGRRILYATPTQEQSDSFWQKCMTALADPVKDGLIYKNESRHILRFPSGGRIRAKTAWNADTLRGDYADLLILDEYAMMDPDAWDLVGAPMLMDNDGDAWFISTPKRRNHFFNLYTRAMEDTTGRWKAWHFTSYDNPYLSEAALAEITGDMTQDAYRQEIMAEFLENEGSVFRNIGACIHAPETTPDQHKGHTLIAGIDWGKQGDYTAISIVCRDCMYEVARDRYNKIDYAFQRQRLIALVKKWGAAVLWPEANSMGEPNIEDLQREKELSGVAVRPFYTTATSKTPLIEGLSLALEREEVQWQDDRLWTAELEAYEVKYNHVTGKPTYSAPEGVHDDTVMARALALHGVNVPVNVAYMPSLYS